MIVADLARFGALVSVPAAAGLGLLTYTQLCVVAVVQTVGAIVANAASNPYLKVSFLLSTMGWTRLRHREPPPPAATGSGTERRWIAEAAAGWRYILAHQVERSDTTSGFVPLAHGWVAERTNGTLMLDRRLARDNTTACPPPACRTPLWASTANLTRRLTGPSASAVTPPLAYHHGDLAHPGEDMSMSHFTRTTLTRLTATGEPSTSDSPLDTTVYQQVLTVFKTGDSGAMRAKDGLPRPRHRHRAQRHRRHPRKLKRPVKRGLLTETEPGLFALATRGEPADQATTSNSNPT